MKKTAFGLVALLASGALVLGCEENSGAGGVGPVGTPDAGVEEGGPIDESSICTAPTGGPTEHEGTITENETWTADKSPHIVKAHMGISATLTIEPCAEVLFAGITGFTVNPTGKLIAEGRPRERIRIAAREADKPFAQLQALGGGTMRFAYVDVENGGHPQNSILDNIGTIHAQGSDGTAPTQEIVFVDRVTVKGSQSNGVFLADGAGFAAGSKDLTVTGSKNYPVSLSTRALSTVPSGTYTGNTIDEILLPAGGGSEAVQEDSTMRDRGVPYRIGNGSTQGYLTVGKFSGPGFSTLTIEPGVTLRFKPGGELIVETFHTTSAAGGALVAVGTAAKPIVFTSASPTPTAGDWIGISLNSIPQSIDKIEHARVEYAGGLTGTGSSTCNTSPGIPDAAIRIRGVPAGQIVTNTTIMNSAAHGIDRGWRSDTKQDYLGSNTFIGIVACNQTYPSDADGSCPGTVPCPK